MTGLFHQVPEGAFCFHSSFYTALIKLFLAKAFTESRRNFLRSPSNSCSVLIPASIIYFIYYNSSQTYVLFRAEEHEEWRGKFLVTAH